jgi:hypothetical protein
MTLLQVSKQVQMSLKSQLEKGASVDIAFNTGHSNDGNPSARLVDSALPDADMNLA